MLLSYILLATINYFSTYSVTTNCSPGGEDFAGEAGILGRLFAKFESLFDNFSHDFEFFAVATVQAPRPYVSPYLSRCQIRHEGERLAPASQLGVTDNTTVVINFGNLGEVTVIGLL